MASLQSLAKAVLGLLNTPIMEIQTRHLNSFLEVTIHFQVIDILMIMLVMMFAKLNKINQSCLFSRFLLKRRAPSVWWPESRSG